MNNAIINPLWIYFIDVLTDLNCWAEIIAMVLGFILLIGGILYVLWRTNDYRPSYERHVEVDKLCMSLIKKGIVLLVITGICAIAIPTDKTMYTMFVTNYITEENIDKTRETVVDTVDYIFEKVDELGE